MYWYNDKINGFYKILYIFCLTNTEVTEAKNKTNNSITLYFNIFFNKHELNKL